MQTFQYITHFMAKMCVFVAKSGCCKPSTVCGLKYINATYWTRSDTNNPYTVPSTSSLFSTTNTTSPKDQTAIDPNTYGDCQAWSNEITQLCYDCESCKRSFISYVNHEWKLHGIFMIAMSCILMAVHTPRFIITAEYLQEINFKCITPLLILHLFCLNS